MSDIPVLSAEDFGEAPAKAGTNPATGQPFTFGEVKQEVLGPPSKASEIEPSAMKRLLAGAGLAFTNKYRGVTGQPAADGFGLEQDTAGSLGMALPDAVGAMTVPARIPAQMAYGAATRGMEPAENILDRGVNAVKGGAEFGGGQALASGVVRGSNAMAGNLSRPGQVASAARPHGLDLTAGDITDSKVLRLMEEKSFGSPSAKQGEQVATMMASATDNPIYNAVQNAYATAQGKVSAAATELDDLIKTQRLPGVTPRKTYDAVRQIKARSPDTLNNVRDPELSAMLDSIANYPANRIPKSTEFSRLDELRKVLGPVMAKIEVQSKSGASNITTSDAARWKQLYKAIMDDIEQWGSTAATEDALKAHKTLRETFKNEVLPLREHPVAGKILDDGYARPEDLLRDLTSNRNKSVINDLYARLDQGGKNAFDALRLTERGSQEFVRGEPRISWARPLTLGGAGLAAGAGALGYGSTATAVAPWLLGALGAEQALVHGLNTGVGRRILGGSAQASENELANRAIHSGLSTLTRQTAQR